jgi:endonuclease YncB( thermonuclease family)
MVVTLLEEEKIFKKINTLKKYGMASLEAITNLVINGKVICQLIKKD